MTPMFFMNFLEAGKCQAANHALRDRAPAFLRHQPAALVQGVSWNGIKKVAPAKRGPVQAVALVQDNLKQFWAPLRPMRRTAYDDQVIFALHALGVGHDHDRMLAEFEFPG